MASEHDSRAHSSDREPRRKRDRFLRPFRSKKSTIATNTEPQTLKSGQSTKEDFRPSSSKTEKSGQVSFDSQKPSLAVGQSQSLPQVENKGNRIATSQVLKSEQKPKKYSGSSPSKSKKPGQVSFDSQNSSLAVDPTQNLPRVEDNGNHGTTTGIDGGQPQDLWMRAYMALEIRAPNLMAEYACHRDPTTPTQHGISPKLFEAIIAQKLHDNETKKLVFNLGSESIKVREQGERIIKFILWSNDFISTAVSAQPYAALAWSGVSVLLPLLLNSSKQKEIMLTGLQSITDLLRWYKFIEELYLQAIKPPHQDLVEAIVELYTNIFEYQVTLILYLSRGSFKRGFQSTFERDDWSGMLDKVQSSNTRCTEYTKLFDTEKVNRFYAEQSAQIEQSKEFQRRILEAFEAFQGARQQDRREDQEAELLQTLASDYQGGKDSLSTPVPGTCQWVFEDKRFLEWRDSETSRLLWISAGPGCGKSVLSRCLIDERRLCTNVMTSTVCYFFFQDGQEQRSKGSNAISAILHQLLRKKCGSSLITHALSSHKSYGNKLPGLFGELWEILIKSARDPDAGEIICVVDALDECEKKDRKQLVEKLVGFLKVDSLKNPSMRLKFIVTSRPYDDLELGFDPILSIDTFTRLDGDEKSEAIGKEIHLVIDDKVPLIARDFSAENRKSISDHLKKLDNRTYLWLFLTLNIIEGSQSKYGKMSSIEELLSSLPSSVSDAYEKILSRSSDVKIAKILLDIVVVASRPLTLEEANIALSIAMRKESCNSHKTLDLWPSKSFKSNIQKMCGLFISVYDSKIFLIHQTAREFLMSRSELHTSSSRCWKGSVIMATAHGTISRICLDYLNLEEFTNMPQKNPVRKFIKNEVEYPFLRYAAEEWPFHYISQHDELAKLSRKAAGMLCRKSLAQLSYWSPIYKKRSLEDFLDSWSELGIASRLGLTYVVEDYLNERIDVNVLNGGRYERGTALTVASAEGHEKVVEMLLNQNADVNVESGSGTALIRASTGGHEKIFEMLLNQNADVNAKSRRYGTALIGASAGGHEKIVEILLNQGSDVNAEDGGFYGTALIQASAEGHEKIVEMLLNRNAEVNVESGLSGTALIGASTGGHEKIVEMLLNQNADVNAESGRYGTALIRASAGGHEKIVEMLLNQNADVNAESGEYGTALIGASVGGHEKIFEMLLNQNADVNAESGQYGTALIGASVRGHDKIVEMLLNRNADVNAKGGYSGTALIGASNEGHEKIVEMLLNRSADVNAEVGGDYGTALIAAAVNGYDKIVEMLLNKEADANAEVGGRYGSALTAASTKGHEKILEMLLNRNADVNAESGQYGTALIEASTKGHGKIVEILLNRNADVNAEVGGRYGTALIGASAEGHEKIVEMLLNQNADVNAEAGGEYGTPLIAASSKGRKKVVEMLLNRNADVNAEVGGDYGTALIAAALNGHEEIVEMLLNRNADVNAQVGGMFGTALTAAAVNGHEEIVEMLLNRNADVNAEGGFSGTALIGASVGGHEKIVEMLLNRNADVNAENGYSGTALIGASVGGHEKIVEVLLNRNADVNAKTNNHYGTALKAASQEGHEEIVEMLLNRNADVNAEAGGEYGTALIAAALNGHGEIVEMLLNRNADVNAEAGGEYGTPLIAASSKGRKKVVEMLLNRNADVNAKTDNHYGTALKAASQEGYEKTVEMLLNRGADFNAECGQYGTPLIAASSKGRKEVVEMLLNRNADVNAENGYSGTALIGASVGGHEKIVEMLLNQNADVNAECGQYGTALVAAASHGHERTVAKLLKRNADINAKCEVYGTALIAAVKIGHWKMVKMLLDRNAAVNAEVGGRYGSALTAASCRNNERIVELLLDRNADVNAEVGGRYGTPLIAASAHGHASVLGVLLDRNATNGRDRALERASAEGYEEVLEILLNRNPDIDFSGKSYRNALTQASSNFRVGSVEMLLNRMIYSNVEAEAYGNALEVALKEEAGGDEDEEEIGEKNEDEKAVENEGKDDSDDEMADRSKQDRGAMIEMLRERKRKISTEPGLTTYRLWQRQMTTATLRGAQLCGTFG